MEMGLKVGVLRREIVGVKVVMGFLRNGLLVWERRWVCDEVEIGVAMMVEKRDRGRKGERERERVCENFRAKFPF